MKIGLIRHFKVKHAAPKKRFLTRADVINWFEAYETADIERKEVDLCGVSWTRCYTSPLNRAKHTANEIHKGEIIYVMELKELDIVHLLPAKIKLPFIVWGILVRLKSLSPNAYTTEFRNKISKFLNEVLSKNENNILIVSHWFVMKILKKELIKKGIKGENFRSPDYGILYVFEKIT